MKPTNRKGGLAQKLLGAMVSVALLLGLVPMAGAQSTQGKSYVALGDSISSGYGLEEGTLSFPQQVAQDNGLELTNLAQNGETSASLLDKLQTPQVAEAVVQADVVTITVGGNDLMNALYGYLTDQYNLLNPDTPTTEEDIRAAVMGGNMGTLSFALGVVPNFPTSERAAQAMSEFTANLTQIVMGIGTANPQAHLVVVEQYNPYSYLVGQLSKNPLFASSAQSLSAAFGAGVTGLNQAMVAVGQQLGYSVALVYDAFETAQENPCNASMSATMKLNLDYHPNAYGHSLIARQVTATMAHLANVTPDGAAFEAQSQGYRADNLTAQTFTLKNLGTQPLSQVTVELAGDNGDSFTLSPAVPDTLEAGDSVSFTVAPREGLAAGTYAAQVVVKAQEIDPIIREVSFQVNPAPTYTLSVEQGSGSGAYAAGQVVTITAEEFQAGQHFAGWTIAQGQGGTLTDSQQAQTTFVMPDHDVTVSATYQAHVMEDGVCTMCGWADGPAASSTQTPPVQTEDNQDSVQLPQTGDTSDLEIWIILVCVTGACLVVVTLWRHRWKKKQGS